MTTKGMRDIGGLLSLPPSIEAIVFDMDGVLLDTVSGDYDLCVGAAEEVTGDGSWISKRSVLDNFALEPHRFWAALIADAPTPVDADVTRLEAVYNRLRETAAFEVLPEIRTLIEAARSAGLRVAVGSSNPTQVVATMLDRSGLYELFEVISGITDEAVSPKPAPDIYANAAKELGVAPAACAFIEDSVTGLQAGKAAGFGFAIAVATGATSIAALGRSDLADALYDRFGRPSIRLIDGAPTDKTLDTPNDFVSHMIEHIAWRTGVGIDLHWRSTDWHDLGCQVGQAVGGLGLRQRSAATLGMIDDGAAEVMIDKDRTPGLTFRTHHSLDEQRILAARVEQVGRGTDLIALLDGVADGIGAHIEIVLCTFDDPHHAWEGVFRAVGICLNRMRAQG